MELILASNSPRRQWLLSEMGLAYTVRAVNVDESALNGEAPEAYVLRVARLKAQAALIDQFGDKIVLAADTAVVDDGAIMGKPADEDHARSMLLSLRGREHQVISGVAVGCATDTTIYTDNCVTRVLMRPYDRTEVEAYIQSGDPMDKAGAYAIQYRQFNPVERVDGCYANVVGLPMCHVVRQLRQFGVFPEPAMVPLCRKLFDFDCEISEKILNES